jgi:deoxyribodipyrimidine photo-lyase
VSLNQSRVVCLHTADIRPGPVVYWMSRDQRVNENWAMLFAQEQAMRTKSPLIVIFCLVPSFLQADQRNYDFMLKGLAEVSLSLPSYGVAFRLLEGIPGKVLPGFLKKIRAGVLVTDFDPLRIKRQWKEDVSKSVDIPFYEVDAHNIVPCRSASVKQEYGAYTIRPRLLKALSEYLTPFPGIKRHPFPLPAKFVLPELIQRGRKRIDVSMSGKVGDTIPGESAASRYLRSFFKNRFDAYSEYRNDPSRNGQSGLSPYLHFGQLSAQKVALEAMASSTSRLSRDEFLEELIIRRELSDNFCFYNENYDSFDGFPAWAQKTLNEHRNDLREYSYSLRRFEQANTHDDLWNAAQKEMLIKGKMHGYMRMYWAKKILEWTGSPEEALRIAIHLNDKYSLDGRDPNGYAGIAWSIGGVHDRAWGERPIFGKVRYMSYNGCKSKFDVKAYIERISKLG